MKRRSIYVLPILLIALGIWLFMNRQENGSISENPETQTVTTDAAVSGEMPIKVTVNNRQRQIPYLTPMYDVKVQHDIVYAKKKNETEALEPLKLDVYQPVGVSNKPRPVFIFIHGGGYSGGSKQDTVVFSTNLAKRGYAVVSVDYRLKKDPDLSFLLTLSDACEDIADVIGWINKNAEGYGLDAGRIAIGGDSAGGHLSINFVNRYLQRDPSILDSVVGIVDLYGGMLSDSVQENWPPVLIIHGTKDNIVPYASSVELSDALEKHGIDHNFLTLEGGGHDYKEDARFRDVIFETTVDFLWNVMSHPDSAWLPEDVGVTAASGDPIDISLPEAYSQDSAEGELQVTLPGGWELEGNQDHTLRLQIPEGMKSGNYPVMVGFHQGAEASPDYVVNVNVITPLEGEMETYFDAADQKVKTRIQLTNRSSSKFSGSYQVDYETGENSEGTYSTAIDQLEPGGTTSLNIPELATGKWTMRGYNQAGTLLQETEGLAHALLIHKLQEPARIDGNLEEWADQAHFAVTDVKMEGWKGAQDLSANGYLSWDTVNLYLALEVTDDRHEQTALGDLIWSGDSVQLAIGITNASGAVPSEYHEIGIARDNQENLLKWRWLAPQGFGTGEILELKQAISRKDQKTVYEAAIPWTELTRGTDLVKPGMKLKFSLLVNDNDGAGRKGWLEYNSGIGSTKDIHAFGDLFLTE